MICTTCTPPYNLDGPGGSTALHAAILNDNEDIQVVEVLIGAARLSSSSSDKDDTHTSFQAFLTQGDKYLNTALHIAVRQGKLATAKLLVEADPSATYIQNEDGKTPIYIAAERGHFDTVKTICTTCTSLSNLEGPFGSTALHAAIKNLHQAKKEDRDVIGLIIAKYANTLKDGVADKSDKDSDEIDWDKVALFNRTDEDRCTILELAVERNEVDVVKLILAQNPAYAESCNRDIISLKPLIYKATDKKYTDIVELLTQVYTASSTRQHLHSSIDRYIILSCTDVAFLISAIEGRQRERASKLILDRHGARTVNFVDNLGWTALHHAAYYEFDSIIDVLVQKQKTFGDKFMYKVLTPFHVAAGKGYTSTVIRLMRLWPSSCSAYTAIDRNEQNILHLAALQSKKEMIQGILKYCSEEYKNKFVNEQDKNGDTPLHILTRRGCYVPELMKYRGLHTEIKNKEEWTPRALLYFEDQIINDQVQIKIALDAVESNHKRDISERVQPSKQQAKDALFKERMRQDIERYKETHAEGQWYADAVNGHAIAKVALEMKADTLNKEEETILHLESKRGDAEHVRYIVEEFANKNLLGKPDRLKQTALHLAAEHHGHTEVVKVLIEAARHLPSSSTNDDDTHNPVGPFQAFIRQATGRGNTALHVAVINGNVATVKLLVEADPSDGHIQNCEGKTPIYIAAEKGYKDIIKVICTTCTALSLEGPGGRTTAFHAAILNMHKEKEDSDVIRMLTNAAKRWSPENAIFEDLFRRTDDSGCTILELAVYRNWVEVVELILVEGPDNQHGRGSKNNSFMRSIYTAIDKKYNDILKLLTQYYEVDIITLEDHKRVTDLIVAIKRRDRVSVIRLLGENKQLVTFADEDGWTPLHLAAYDQFDSILDPIIQAQKDVGHLFAYSDKDVPTPFHIAAEKGYTLTVIRLMELWPASSSAYTNVNNDGQNILHLAALKSKKEMIKGILKHCPKRYQDQMVNKQDKNGDTPLHLLIIRGCFIPEILKHKGLKTMTKNNRDQTPLDYFYLEEEIIADQVQIKITLDDIDTDQSWKCWRKNIKAKSNYLESVVLPDIREAKDVKFEDAKKDLVDKKRGQMKRDLEKYKKRTNTQIVVTALITTVAFTVGFTMPGGLYQSGELDQGLVVLSKKTAFRAFMVSDALALLLSTCSLFLYFLESMYEDLDQVAKLNTASTALNIVSVVAMMLTFITGTYVVLSHSPALAITVCIIGSFFFLFVIVLLIKMVYDRQVKKKNED